MGSRPGEIYPPYSYISIVKTCGPLHATGHTSFQPRLYSFPYFFFRWGRPDAQRHPIRPL